ncbi:MAG: DUF1810 domain-containing protein [Rubrivivax sp.]|nr:MAG: DUF1810 domain-containing protein [Rubrivivax sp.]
MTSDPFDLERFVQVQAPIYAIALDEVKAGRKRSHWMWFILPQLRGLGASAMAQKFGVSGMEEAEAYIAHPVLGPRLVNMVEAMLSHTTSSAEAILGGIDARKFQSCLTLFSLAAPAAQASLMDSALQQFFSGERDASTLRLLAA